MYNIKTLNKISNIGMDRFNDNYKWGDDIENPDAIMLRSFNMHDMDIPKTVRAIARAGAGVNNIPLDKCSEQGIAVFNIACIYVEGTAFQSGVSCETAICKASSFRNYNCSSYVCCSVSCKTAFFNSAGIHVDCASI